MQDLIIIIISWRNIWILGVRVAMGIFISLCLVIKLVWLFVSLLRVVRLWVFRVLVRAVWWILSEAGLGGMGWNRGCLRVVLFGYAMALFSMTAARSISSIYLGTHYSVSIQNYASCSPPAPQPIAQTHLSHPPSLPLTAACPRTWMAGLTHPCCGWYSITVCRLLFYSVLMLISISCSYTRNHWSFAANTCVS